MALFGRQKDYDENGDGRLSSSEWQEWYWETYGADLEREERRKKAEAKRAAEVRRELQWREALSPPLRALERILPFVHGLHARGTLVEYPKRKNAL